MLVFTMPTQQIRCCSNIAQVLAARRGFEMSQQWFRKGVGSVAVVLQLRDTRWEGAGKQLQTFLRNSMKML